MTENTDQNAISPLDRIANALEEHNRDAKFTRQTVVAEHAERLCAKLIEEFRHMDHFDYGRFNAFYGEWPVEVQIAILRRYWNFALYEAVNTKAELRRLEEAHGYDAGGKLKSTIEEAERKANSAKDYIDELERQMELQRQSAEVVQRIENSDFYQTFCQ